MACEKDLAEVMQNALEQSGDLALLHAQLEERLGSFASKPQSLLQGPSSSLEVNIAKPTMPNEVYLANELIREYLNLIGCNKAASVLVTESGLPAEPMSSYQLRKALAPGKKLDRNGPLLGIMVDFLHK